MARLFGRLQEKIIITTAVENQGSGGIASSTALMCVS